MTHHDTTQTEAWTPGGALLLDGRRARNEMLSGLKAELMALGSPSVCLATVLVGADEPSRIYVRMKHRSAEQAGMTSCNVELPASATQSDLEAAVRELAEDPAIHGILVQLPLPDGFDTESVLACIPTAKDVDGLTSASMGRLVRGLDGHLPCTPLGVIKLLDRYQISTAGRRAVVVGRSTLVGLPLMLLLSRRGCDATVTLAHSRTRDLQARCREADIIIAAAGNPNMVTADFVRTGATIIDVGVSRVEGNIVGDVEFDSVEAVAGAITPMPGGTGPMTIACLLENTLNAARMLGAVPPRTADVCSSQERTELQCQS